MQKYNILLNYANVRNANLRNFIESSTGRYKKLSFGLAVLGYSQKFYLIIYLDSSAKSIENYIDLALE